MNGIASGGRNLTPQGIMRWLQRPDPAYAILRGRVQRLTVVSSIALGVIWWLARSEDEADALARTGLLAGWALMPTVLAASLGAPGLKYGLVLPSSLVLCSLVAIALASFPSAGWLLLTSGIALGGLMGMWFWFRWVPVPQALELATSRARLALIAVHVSLILGGMTAVVL